MSEARRELLTQLRDACERINSTGRVSKGDREAVTRIERALRNLKD